MADIELLNQDGFQCCWHCRKPLKQRLTEVPTPIYTERNWPFRYGAALLHEECLVPYIDRVTGPHGYVTGKPTQRKTELPVHLL